MSADSGIIERIYSHFLGRDLSYLAGGGLPIVVFEWVWLGSVPSLTGYSPRFLAFCVASYFLGLALSEAASLSRFAPKQIDVDDHMSRCELMVRLNSMGAGPGLQEHERTIALMHFGASAFGAGFASATIIGSSIVRVFGESLASPQLIVAFVLSVAGTVLSACYTKWKNGQAREERLSLIRIARKGLG